MVLKKIEIKKPTETRPHHTKALARRHKGLGPPRHAHIVTPLVGSPGGPFDMFCFSDAFGSGAASSFDIKYIKEKAWR